MASSSHAAPAGAAAESTVDGPGPQPRRATRRVARCGGGALTTSYGGSRMLEPRLFPKLRGSQPAMLKPMEGHNSRHDLHLDSCEVEGHDEASL